MNHHPKRRHRSRRLQKKLHIGPFQEFGADVHFRVGHEVDIEGFFSDFIAFVVRNDWLFGGSFGESEVSGFVCGDRGGRFGLADIQAIQDWTAARTEVNSFTIGELRDVWY